MSDSPFRGGRGGNDINRGSSEGGSGRARNVCHDATSSVGDTHDGGFLSPLSVCQNVVSADSIVCKVAAQQNEDLTSDTISRGVKFSLSIVHFCCR